MTAPSRVHATLSLALLLAACGGSSGGGAADTAGADLAEDAAGDAADDAGGGAEADGAGEDVLDEPWPSYPLDDVLRLNHVQALGTHNSYHLEPAEVIHPSHAYSHAPLDVQLGVHGVRQVELDLHLRSGEGFEVFHLPTIDEETTCRRFTDCLALLREWSDGHPGHLPLVVWLEPKDLDLDWVDASLDRFVGDYDGLEADILSVWPRERLLVPDDVRGAHATLPEAVAADGWPTLGALRGKAIFALLDSSEHRDAYVADAPNLAGRLMFVDASSPEDPFAAFFKVDDGVADGAFIRGLVEAGFIVTSNTDSLEDPDAANGARLAATLAAGVHFLATDRPAPGPPGAWTAAIPGGRPARCNPVFPAEACTPADIEDLSGP